MVDALNAIFRKAIETINAIIEAVQTLASQIISDLGNLITNRIDRFQSFLNAKVDALLTQTFPDLAVKLNAALDKIFGQCDSLSRQSPKSLMLF